MPKDHSESVPAMASTSRSRRAVPVRMLMAPNDMQRSLRASLPTFGHIQWVERTLSTNADLYTLARQPHTSAPRPWLLGAHLQDQGRGRAGRTWQNRQGANLMFSCAFDVFLPPRKLPSLSLLAGLTACETLRGLVAPPRRHAITMKWPNDIQWDFAKLAGILVEVTRAGTARLSNDHHVAIIGMGINLNDARALSQSLDRRIADWSQIAAVDAGAASVSAAGLAGRIAQAWYATLNQASTHGLDNVITRYSLVDALAGQHVDVIDDGTLRHSGIACGINSYGQLLVRTPNGDQAIHVGEVSVRARRNTV